MRGLFVSSTGTSEGKTVVTKALAAALLQSGLRVAALKPMETGCKPVAEDAIALANAAGDPSLAERPGFFRAQLPASPYAVQLEGEQPAPSLSALAHAVSLAAGDHQYQGVLVEGAGGLFVPITRTQLVADLVHMLQLPVLLVATNRLGVLSNVLAAHEAAVHRGLRFAAVVLNRRAADDESTRTNQVILAERLDCPVIEFPSVDQGDPVAAAVSSGLLRIAMSELENV